MSKALLSCMAGMALGVCSAGGAHAQTSEYYLFSGDQSRFTVIQNGEVVRTWAPAAGTAQYQYPMVVMETIRTMGANVGDTGGEYSLAGADLGARYTHPAGSSRCWDGATDGTDHFSIDSAGAVWRFDREWQSPARLFGAGGIGSLAYDPADNTLWVSQFGTMTIRQFSLSGAVLFEFSTGHAQNMALALDPADDTLWLHDRTATGTYEQWTKAGVRLQRLAVPGMSGQNCLAGEFQFNATPPCYPDCDTSTGVGVLDIFDFLCFQNRYDAGSAYACDCDTSTGPGVCDIFDFLCFQNAYDAGCP